MLKRKSGKLKDENLKLKERLKLLEDLSASERPAGVKKPDKNINTLVFYFFASQHLFSE